MCIHIRSPRRKPVIPGAQLCEASAEPAALEVGLRWSALLCEVEPLDNRELYTQLLPRTLSDKVARQGRSRQCLEPRPRNFDSLPKRTSHGSLQAKPWNVDDHGYSKNITGKEEEKFIASGLEYGDKSEPEASTDTPNTNPTTGDKPWLPAIATSSSAAGESCEIRVKRVREVVTSVIATASGYWDTREVISGLSAKRGAAPGGLPLHNVLRRYQVRGSGSGNAKGARKVVCLEGTPRGTSWGVTRRYALRATSRGYALRATSRGYALVKLFVVASLVTASLPETFIVLTDVIARLLLWLLGTAADFCCSATRGKVDKQMLSSRAAAFSVKALLTAPGHQEAKLDGGLREAKNEDETPCPQGERKPSESPAEVSSARHEAPSAPSPLPASPAAEGEGPAEGGDCAMEVLPEGRTRGDGEGDGRAGDDDDDEDLIVDVESNSPSPSPAPTPHSPQSAASGPSRGSASGGASASGSPVSVICRTPGAGSPTPSLPASASACTPVVSQQYQDEVFLPQSPSSRADWQVYSQSSTLGVRWVGPEAVGSQGDGDVSIHLLQQDLWAKFHSLGTEMIITKNGRRMFPVVKVCLRGLDPERNYMLYMDMTAVDTRRYRYVYPSSRWMVAGTGEPLGDQAPYIHPDSPASGVQWMASPTVAFDRLKLTNNKTRESRGQIILHSMQKYQPRIWVQEVPAGSSWADLPRLVDRHRARSAVFQETVFITVTAYQNQQITRLKIDSNPFAKGFRDTTKQKDLLDRRPTASATRTPDPPSLPPASPFLLGFPFPPHLHYPPRIPGLPPQYALGGPLSPPISPLLLPPHPWLHAADPVDAGPGGDGGGRPLAPWEVAELGRAAPAPFLPAAAVGAPPSHPFFISSLLSSGAGPLPPALDLSKRKGDT
ncbi:eomesodermin homolog [Penaeus chinensis]|uniref:eomesodermin homolog n=1 Tax=Penaeus chinensis TaxID=139456 RepID=UPI001FB6C5ED|nr:eomesodermin homolog [Penaeus chinensis]